MKEMKVELLWLMAMRNVKPTTATPLNSIHVHKPRNIFHKIMWLLKNKTISNTVVPHLTSLIDSVTL